jgi:tetratricopeptide (TPR) repeat protein
MSEYYQQGLDKARAQDYPGAIEAFEMALISNPNWAEVYYRRGLVYFDLNDLMAAVADYTKSVDLDPRQKDPYYARALARLILKNFSGALADIEKAILFGRDHAPNYQLKGMICQKLAQRADAIQAYKLAASLYLKQQDLENSRLCLTKAAELTPPVPGAVITLPISYATIIAKAEAGDLWGANQDADSAIRANPQDARAYCCRGMIYKMRDNLAGALTDFNTAIRLDPSCNAYLYRGKMRQQMGDWQGAIDDFTQAVTINPQDPQSLVCLAQAYGARGEHDLALVTLERVLAIDPQNPAAYVERAQLRLRSEDIAAARADYQTAANLYLERQDLVNYQGTLAKLQNIARRW